MRIPLPRITKGPNARAHPYPFQISYQTLEFLQGSLFYASFVDLAAGEFVRLPDGMSKIEKIFTQKPYSKKTYDEAWSYLEKYRVIFEKVAFQAVLIALNSHWDWFIRKLGEFIVFARSKSGDAVLSRPDERRLARVSFLPIIEQLEIIEVAGGIKLPLKQDDRTELEEMGLVRNLGLHNRSEVDAWYLTKTQRKGLNPGDLRIIDVDELYVWHGLLISLVNESAQQLAVAFVAVPDYP